MYPSQDTAVPEGREMAIFADRKRKLTEARTKRARNRRQANPETVSVLCPVSLAVTVACET